MLKSILFFLACVFLLWYNAAKVRCCSMKTGLRIVIALCLILSVLLSGCTILDNLLRPDLVPYSQMEYSRPNMVEFAQVLESSCQSALEETDLRKLEDAIWAFYDVYDAFYTNMNLALIAHCRDLTDIYWEEEYGYCAAHSATVDAGLDQLYRHLAQSPLRHTLEGEDYFGADYFDSFEGESVYDAELNRMLNEEAELCTLYQSLSGQASAVTYYSEEYFDIYGSQMEEVFLQLVQLRQQIASYLGYDSYPAFAYDFYHMRDYTPQQAVSYLADIRAELVPLYQKFSQSDFWNQELPLCTEEETFQYVKKMARNMGGTIASAFTDMSAAGVYDLSYGANKYAASFEIYLTTYYTPYIFLNPTGTAYDKLSFAHEFGHFCSDYTNLGGSMQGVDVSEVISQGMEYLSLIYADAPDELQALKMADCLSIYVEQAAFASFEHQVYQLSGEELTVEGIRSLYEQICISFGMDAPHWDSRDYVCIPHFFESPMYIISYVLSNDAAFQIYEMELAQKGSGLACLENSMVSSSYYFMDFIEQTGIEDPFAAGRLSKVRQTLEALLQ